MCRCEGCNLHFSRACQEAHPRCATIAKVNYRRNHGPYAADVRAFRTPSHLPSDPSTSRATALSRSFDIACSRYHGRQPTTAVSCSYRSPHRLPARPPTTTFQDVLLTDVTSEHLPAAAEATPVALRRYQYVCALYGPHHVPHDTSPLPLELTRTGHGAMSPKRSPPVSPNSELADGDRMVPVLQLRRAHPQVLRDWLDRPALGLGGKVTTACGRRE